MKEERENGVEGGRSRAVVIVPRCAPLVGRDPEQACRSQQQNKAKSDEAKKAYQAEQEPHGAPISRP